MNLSLIEDKLFVVSENVGVSAYDFDFNMHFSCSHPYRIKEPHPCVMRIGAIQDYATEYRKKLDLGLQLVNSPDDHILASELEAWYPFIQELTPRTIVFDSLPDTSEIEAQFNWPVFLKGSRQTSKHNPDLAIIKNREHYEKAVQLYQRDTILHWQKPVIREFIPLSPASGSVAGKVRSSIEYRSFWWYGKCVGWGRYWYQIPAYESTDIAEGLKIAELAASRLAVPFLVVDFAKTLKGQWIVIECNDAQESGYAGIRAQHLWKQVLKNIQI